MPSFKVNFSSTNDIGTGIASAAQAGTLRPTMMGPHIADRRTLSRRTFCAEQAWPWRCRCWSR